MTGPAASPPAGGSDGEGLRLDFLYRRQRLSLIRYFTRNRATPSDAEDLTQEAFLRVTNADAAGGIARPEAYLHQVGRNLLRDHTTAPARRHETGDPDCVDRAVSEPSELGRLEARDTLRRIEEALQRLKPKTREIFLAHRLDGMTYGEIAERAGMSVKGVEKQMSKAIAAVGRVMERHG